MAILMEIHDLTLNIEHFSVVDEVSFTIHKGQTVALLGESGSGKSLTALSMARLLPDSIQVQQGECTLYSKILLPNRKKGSWDPIGYNLHALPEHILRALRGRSIGFIFQEPSTCLNPVMTVGEQIAEVVRLHLGLKGKEAREKVIFWLEKVGIERPQQRMSDYPHQFSGGQKQRIMIAMALAGQPEILIADEPTTALDVTIQQQILDLLKSLQQQLELTILFITHDLGIVQYMADTVVVLEKGRCVAQGTVSELFGSQSHPYTQSLALAIPNRSQRGKALAVDPSQAQQFAAPDPKAPEVLSIQNLEVAYPIYQGLFRRKVAETKVLDGVSLHLQQGHTLSIVGGSGCGKTTLAKALMRLLDPTVRVDGEFRLLQQTQTEMSLKQWRQGMQMVFQDPFASLNPRMRIYDILAEGMQSLCPDWDATERERRILRLLDQVGLPRNTIERFAHEFSGGQRQRIAIARALAVEPKVLICDEPTSALDVTVQAQILNLLQTIQQETQTAILLITHNFAVVEYLSDEVAVMDSGKIVEYGSVENILLQPQHAVTKELLQAAQKTAFKQP